MTLFSKRIIIVLMLCVGVSFSAHAERPYGALEMDQSGYALGSTTLNVIMLESDGSAEPNLEDWTIEQSEMIFTEVMQSVDFWESQTAGYHEAARLDFEVNFVNGGVPVATSYEPISRDGTNIGTKPWILDVMGELGYGSYNQFTAIRDFNEDQREAFGTDWATTLFVINSQNDVDGKFANSMAAYAYLNGPYLVTTYDNGGWGINSYDRVLSHELGHIFGALDEYSESGRRNTETSGYLNGVNGNAELGASGESVVPPEGSSLMLNIASQLSEFSKVQVGHVDSDGDTIPDILDTNPLIVGSTNGSNVNEGLFVFNGTSVVNPIENLNRQNIGSSNSTNDMTINRIASGWYNLDGGGWEVLAAGDFGYGDFTEDLSLTLPDLDWGDHTIEFRTFNTVGNSSQVLSFDFASRRPIPGDLNFDGLLGSDDITMLVDQIQGEQGGETQGDLNDDGEVDLLDQGILHSRMIDVGWSPPDFNDDGGVTLVDLDILGMNYGMENATILDGDANGDGMIDELDLAIYGSVVTIGGSQQSAPAAPISTPQPATLMMLLGGVGMLSSVRFRAYKGS